MVAWFGGGNWGVGLSFGGPAVGWVPLGWGEPYYPYYHVSRGYFRNVNVYNTRITNITVIENNYYNRRGHEFENVHYVNQQHGFSAVNRGVLEHGRPVARDLVRVNDHDFQGGRFMRNADVTPTRAAVLGGREDVPAAIPPRGVMNRPIVSKMTPPARPARFEDRVPRADGNRGIAGNPDATMRRDGPGNRPAATPGTPAATGEPGRPSNADMHRPAVGDRTGNPAGNRSMDANNARPDNAPGHVVPRPPVRSPRVINMEGNASENGPKNGEPARSVGSANAPANEHYVPRPPERQRVTMDTQGNSSHQDNGTPSPETRRNSQPSETTRVPQNGRSPVFDRNNEKDAAEVATPRNVPRPPENNAVRNENHAPANVERPAAERNASPRNESPRNESPRNDAVAPGRSVQENRPARSVERAPKTERNVPHPSEDKPAKSDSGKRSSLRPYPSPYSASGSYSVRPASYSPGSSSARASSFSPRSDSYSSRYQNNSRTDRPAYSRPSSSYTPSYSRGDSSPSYSHSAAPRATYSRSAPSYSAPRAYTSGRSYGGGSYASRSSGGGAARSYGGGGSRSYGGGSGRSYSGGASHSSGGSAGRHR
jgi:hypothetical protein